MFVNSYIFFSVVIIHAVSTLEVGDVCSPSKDVTDGVCTEITECDLAIKSIRNKNSHDFSRCGFSGYIEIVCCPKTTDRFGPVEPTEQTRTPNRIADTECQKIIASSIPPLDLHIIGGESASLGEFPHMVALGFDRDNSQRYQFDCGGSLLSNRHVLTAAHCVDTLDKIEPSMVRTGVVELSGDQWNDETDIRIAQVIKHPEYTRREKYHDLAILKLEKPVDFSSNLNAACLYTSDEDPAIQLTITGWGTTSTTKDARSNVLLKANVTVVSRARCSESYTNWRKLPVGISEQQLCAGDPDGLRDTCQGDSGGPLQGITKQDGQYRLVGVTSFGRGCGSAVPGVYTRLSHYLDWIESVVWPQ